MKKILSFIILAFLSASPLWAQFDTGDYNSMGPDGVVNNQRNRQGADSLGTDKEIPEGIHVWTVDPRFGDRVEAKPDTASHMFMNSIFTTGMRSEYNSTGNLGAPRQARLFIDRMENNNFIFVNPYDYVVTPVEKFQFTNTLSPLTNISYNNCGNRTNGEDHFKTKFAVNAGKRLGIGFLIDYIYGRGYYNAQSTSHFKAALYGSYMGERYQAHLLFNTLHEKVTENGGITSELYITHPESFNENFATSEIPTMLEQNWNRNDNQHIFFTQRYSVGFNRKVPMTPEEIKARKFAIESQKEQDEKKARAKAEKEAMDAGVEFDKKNAKLPKSYSGRPDNAKVATKTAPADSAAIASGRVKVNGKNMADSLLAASNKAKEDTSWLKDEYVPVTSFIHTADFTTYRRIYEAYATPENYYLDTYKVKERLAGDSIYDKTSNWNLRNTFAIALLEGFNKWIKTGAKVFATHTLSHYVLPDSVGTTSWNEHSVAVGAQLSKTQGKSLHFNVTGDVAVVGYNVGEIKIDGGVDLNFPLLGDTMTLAASGFYHHVKPSFYFRHYQSRHLWWDSDDLSMIDHLRAQGVLNYAKTRTRFRFAFDEIKNYAYFASSFTNSDDNGRLYNMAYSRQASSPITVLTAEVAQDLAFGPLHWETTLTWQKSTNQDVLPLPAINAYTNLYLRFKIARVLNCDFGADARFFTKYAAPDYFPSLGQYTVQENENKQKIGGYPVINAYFNFKLSRARFFVMMSHVNCGSGNKEYFFTPNYPLNGRVFRFGISWDFAN
uniref:putative porin n=1 Tax=Prevotella sp. TaxID=59823 RepID=UPI004029C6A1